MLWRLSKVLRAVFRKVVVVLGAYVAGIFLILGAYTGVAICNDLDYSFTFVYGVCPVLQIKDAGNVLLPEPHPGGDFDTPAGNYGPVVVVDEQCWEDKSFLLHELAHVQQRYRWFFLGFHLLYMNSEQQRIFFEYEAYRAENVGVSNREIALQLSMEIYGNGLSQDQILQIINRYEVDQIEG